MTTFLRRVRKGGLLFIFLLLVLNGCWGLLVTQIPSLVLSQDCPDGVECLFLPDPALQLTTIRYYSIRYYRRTGSQSSHPTDDGI